MKIYDERSSFYQWDVNQKLTSPHLSEGDEVHFYNVTLSRALVVKAYALDDVIVADVPNILLTKPLDITAYKYTTEGDSSATREEFSFSVQKRAKPDDYVYTPTECVTIKGYVNAALQAAKDSGTFDGTDGENGLTPYIKNGNWWIGDEDTGVKAAGHTPKAEIKNGILYVE